MCRSSRSRPTRCQLGVIGFDSTPEGRPGGNLLPPAIPRWPAERSHAVSEDSPARGASLAVGDVPRTVRARVA